MLKFSYRNEFLLTSEHYPLLQYAYVQECLQKNIPIHIQLIYIQLPKKSKKLGQKNPIVEPDIFPSINKQKSKSVDLNQQLLPLQSISSLFKFNFRLPPLSDVKLTTFQFHSGIYYGRRCLYSFDPINWTNSYTEAMTLTTTLPIANLLPGTLLCFALISKQSELYFLNISLFHSNGSLLNGQYEFRFNQVNPIHNLANTKHLYPDSYIGSTNNETITNNDNNENNEISNNYRIKLKFENQSYRFYSNEEISEKLKQINLPTPTVVSTAKQQQQHDTNDDVANGEAVNYLLGILNDEVRIYLLF